MNEPQQDSDPTAITSALADRSAQPPAELVELLDRAAKLAQGSRSRATWVAYRRDWAGFIDWCATRGLIAMPAAPATVCAWLADLAPTWREATREDALEVVVEGQVQTGPGLSPATIARRLASVSVAHQTAAAENLDAELANPAGHPSVRQVMAGIRRHPGVAPTRRREAAGSVEVNAMTDGLDPHTSAVDARDLALLYLALGAALRRSDLARLDLDDLTTSSHGLSVRIRRSKTDQEGKGQVRGIAADDDGGCAAAEAVELWRAHLAREGITRGALWRPIHRARSGRETIRPTRLSGHAINDIVARRAAQAGLDGDYGGHSLRRGFATEALAAGATEHAVMTHGGWRSPTAMRTYVAEAGTFAATNPTRGLRLHRPGRRDAEQ